MEKLDGPCIIGSGKQQNMGYWWVYHEGKRVLLHRLVVSRMLGVPLAKMGGVVRHACDNRACISERHLRLGTQRENIEDAVRRNRMRGTARTIAPETVREVRRLLALKMRHTDIARATGIKHPSCVRQIALGQAYKDIQ